MVTSSNIYLFTCLGTSADQPGETLMHIHGGLHLRLRSLKTVYKKRIVTPLNEKHIVPLVFDVIELIQIQQKFCTESAPRPI